MKKLKIFQILLIVIFILFIVFLFFPKNYAKEYNLNGVAIQESYTKNGKYYYFTFTYKDTTLDYLIESKYHQQRGLIESLEIIQDDDNFCLIPKGKLNFIPLCYQNNEAIHYSLVSKNLKKQLPDTLFSKTKQLSTYEDINIYNQDYTYLIWNYNGFYYINSRETKKINILEKELYTINLVGYTTDYLVVADYDSNYTFNRFYTIAFKDGNYKKYELDRNIYFDSYFLGYIKNKAYLVDNKESAMYEFNAKHGQLEKIKSKVLNSDGEWQKVNIKTLINKKQEFPQLSNYEYQAVDNNLYLKYKNKDLKVLVDQDITHIIRTKNSDIFYLKGDSLYHFNEATGSKLLLTYFEWNFSYENMIYIN